MNQNQNTQSTIVKQSRDRIGVNAQLEVFGKRPLHVRTLRLVAYFLFAIFAALLTTSNFIVGNNVNPVSAGVSQHFYNMGIWWIIWLGIVGTISVVVMMFVGRSFRDIWPVKYFIGVLLVIATLFVTIIISTSIYQFGSSLSNAETILARAKMYMIIGIINGIVQVAVLVYFMILARKVFPTTLSRAIFSLPWPIVYAIVGILLQQYAYALYSANNSQQTTALIVIIVLALALAIYFFIVLIYSNLFKNNVISNMTNRELEIIERNRELFVFSVINISAIVFIQPIVLVTTSISVSSSDNPAFLIVGALISFALVVTYIFMRRTRRRKLARSQRELNLDATKGYNPRLATTNALENSILNMIFLFAIVLINTVLIGFSNYAGDNHTSSVFLLTVVGLSYLVITFYNQFSGLKLPNIKNHTSMVVVVIVFVITLLIGILFSTVNDASIIKIFLKLDLVLWLGVIVTVGFFVLTLVNVYVTYVAITGQGSFVKRALSRKDKSAPAEVNQNEVNLAAAKSAKQN